MGGKDSNEFRITKQEDSVLDMHQDDANGQTRLQPTQKWYMKPSKLYISLFIPQGGMPLIYVVKTISRVF